MSFIFRPSTATPSGARPYSASSRGDQTATLEPIELDETDWDGELMEDDGPITGHQLQTTTGGESVNFSGGGVSVRGLKPYEEQFARRMAGKLGSTTMDAVIMIVTVDKGSPPVKQWTPVLENAVQDAYTTLTLFWNSHSMTRKLPPMAYYLKDAGVEGSLFTDLVFYEWKRCESLNSFNYQLKDHLVRIIELRDKTLHRMLMYHRRRL